MQYNFKIINLIKQFATLLQHSKTIATTSVISYILVVKTFFGFEYMFPSIKGLLPYLEGFKFPLILTIPSQEESTLGESGSMPYLPGVCHGKVI